MDARGRRPSERVRLGPRNRRGADPRRLRRDARRRHLPELRRGRDLDAFDRRDRPEPRPGPRRRSAGRRPPLRRRLRRRLDERRRGCDVARRPARAFRASPSARSPSSRARSSPRRSAAASTQSTDAGEHLDGDRRLAQPVRLGARRGSQRAERRLRRHGRSDFRRRPSASSRAPTAAPRGSQTGLDAKSLAIAFVAVNPANSSQIAAVSSGQSSYFQSSDGGATWTTVSVDAACGGVLTLLYSGVVRPPRHDGRDLPRHGWIVLDGRRRSRRARRFRRSCRILRTRPSSTPVRRQRSRAARAASS